MSVAPETLNPLDVALRVAAALEAVGCEYFVGGSVASSLQGEPRATNDIDIVVALMPHRIGAFVKELGPDSRSMRSRSEMRSCEGVVRISSTCRW